MKGKGYVHPNVLEEISFTKGALISSNDELPRAVRRENTVELPFAHSLVRSVVVGTELEHFQLSEQTRARQVLQQVVFGVGPEFSASLNAAQKSSLSVDALMKRAREGQGGATSLLEKLSQKYKLPTASNESRSVNVVMDHTVSGQRTFAWVDHDGVMSGGVVPEVIKHQTENENEDVFIREKNMSEAEQVAFHTLLKDLKGGKLQAKGEKREREAVDEASLLESDVGEDDGFDQAELERILQETGDRLGL